MRVLVVSYHFPPAPGVAPARVGKLVKYLLRAGWKCAIVAAPPGPDRDGDLLADVAGAEVDLVLPRRESPRLQRLDWAAAALPVARRRARHADVVLVSGAPFAPLLLGPALGRPYVLDLRDPWSWEPRFDRFRAGRRRAAARTLERAAEAFALRRAAAVTTVAPEIAQTYEELYPWLAGRMTVVRHGFDPEDFGDPVPGPPEPPTLVHVGTMLAGERTPELMIGTARRLRERGIPIRVKLVGDLPRDLAARSGEPWVEVLGRLPRRAAIAEMRAASVLWLEPGSLEFLITGKVYEYLASGRPIVAVAPETGSVARLLRATGGAAVVPADTDECAGAVERSLAGSLPPRDAAAVSELAQPGPADALAAVLARAAVRRGRW